MIKIICVGKIKEKYNKDAVEEYLKRLSKYTNIEIVEVQDYDYDLEKTLIMEKNEILKHIKLNDYLISLDINGEELNSEVFSKTVDTVIQKSKVITFIIGGSYGLHNEIKEKSNKIISFSKLTFPHQLFRVLFLEQIYRAFKIINNEKYHK
ncbi:MAG TPA: 23S rRNA (pseudouridine(1915)-N(3))-methyltransferase RlmH [Bacilli bacterium]|nr:23S rRNA (pseudouridine(1915)-N(3))-methyltransferase RlmH [Bacilli bacterium]